MTGTSQTQNGRPNLPVTGKGGAVTTKTPGATIVGDIRDRHKRYKRNNCRWIGLLSKKILSYGQLSGGLLQRAK